MPSSEDAWPRNASRLERALEALVRTLNERGIRYAIVGGIALTQHARVRTTVDIDVLLVVPQLVLPGFLEALRERGFTIDLKRNISEFRQDGFTALSFDGIPVDLMQPVIPAFSRVLDTAISVEMLGQPTRICSAEGLILMKLAAWRLQDQADVHELLTAYGHDLNLAAIRSEPNTLASPDDARHAQFEALVRETIG
ncbi:MAG TPA: nucleotidyltransferase [Phycisphaerae bacterium]|nr:nucleotidyltransferase [Phycisphaerae bacterium]